MTARATFKQSDLTRAIRAVQSAGLKVVRTEIDDAGRIVLIHEGESKPATGRKNTCDEIF